MLLGSENNVIHYSCFGMATMPEDVCKGLWQNLCAVFVGFKGFIIYFSFQCYYHHSTIFHEAHICYLKSTKMLKTEA